MNRITTLLAPAICCFAFASDASAVTLSLLPNAQDVLPGSTVSLDLVISGLVAGAPPSLGDFDLDLRYDSDVLDLLGFELGSSLGDPARFEAIDVSFGEFAPGLVNLAELSLLSAAELDALQSDAFVLATLEFLVGTLPDNTSTTIGFDVVHALGDTSGNSLAITALEDATLTGNAQVPLPGGLALLAPVLWLLGRLRCVPS